MNFEILGFQDFLKKVKIGSLEAEITVILECVTILNSLIQLLIDDLRGYLHHTTYALRINFHEETIIFFCFEHVVMRHIQQNFPEKSA